MGNGLGDGEDGRIRLSSVDIAGSTTVEEGGIEDRRKCWYRVSERRPTRECKQHLEIPSSDVS